MGRTRAVAALSTRVDPAKAIEHFAKPTTQEDYIALEDSFGARNYHPLPVVLAEGKGAVVWDTDGNEYLDFLSAYSAVNQGHCHPKIINALVTQASKLTLTSRAFHNNLLGEFCAFMTSVFGFDRLLPMNTGVEACETAVKLARKWGYEVKGIPQNQAKVIFAENNFWGRSISAVSSSSDPESYSNFGPFTPGFELIPYNDLDALKEALKDPNVCAFMAEPIQGEAGVILPDEGYLKGVREACSEANVLWIDDEVQAGLGRAGTLLCVDHDNVKPDIVVMGKALSGGVLPVSCVMTSSEVMLTIRPGQHGSTYGGNPLACAVATTAIQVLIDEKMPENSLKLGAMLRDELAQVDPELITNVRGRGLFSSITIPEKNGVGAWDFCMMMKERGMLAKPTHGDKIRLAPPLVLSESQLHKSVDIIADTAKAFKKLV